MSASFGKYVLSFSSFRADTEILAPLSWSSIPNALPIPSEAPITHTWRLDQSRIGVFMENISDAYLEKLTTTSPRWIPNLENFA